MSRLQRALNEGDRGFSLIEVIVAISVFAILSLGMAPLIVSSIRGSDLSRSFTVGKNLATESMERVRGLPFFDTAAGRDILDLYFPNLVASGTDGYNSANQIFRTTCTPTSSSPATSGPKACPPEHADGTAAIPVGFTVTFEAQFVAPVAASSPEIYSIVTPPATYDSAAAGTATPPSSLLKMTTRVTWNRVGARTFQLITMLGDRKLSPDRVRATASIDFMLNVLTSYKQIGGVDTGRLSSLTAIAGRSKADIEIRSFSAAQTDNNAGTLVLARDATAGDPDSGGVLDSVFGASAGFRSPPNSVPAIVTVSSDTIDHPDLVPAGVDMGFLGQSSVNDSTVSTPAAQVLNGLPKAAGNFTFPGGTGTNVFWVSNQANRSDPLLQLHPTKDMFTVLHNPQERLKGDTYTEATDILPAAGRKVEATADGEIGKIIVLPTSFATGDQGMVVIDDFVVEVDCKSTGLLATSVATGSWSASLKYWRDNNPSDGLPIGSYSPAVAISGSTTGGGTDPLAAIKTANPVVFDLPGTLSDVHLFTTGGVSGYLEDWSTTPDMTTFKDAQNVRVSMDRAINMVTARTDISNEETKLTIDIGKVSCQAADKRG